MIVFSLLACTGFSSITWECQVDSTDAEYATSLGCEQDFEFLASAPLDASIPGARSAKTVVDRADGNALYFQNSELYPIHWDFAVEHLSGDGLPLVPSLGEFNATEYYSPDRRFVLGALTYYEEPAKWVYEISPYDTATSQLIALAFDRIRLDFWAGSELYFHANSTAVEAAAESLPPHIPIITTGELFADITYQALNLGTAMGQLRFMTTEELEDSIPSYREVLVLDSVPNDIAIVAALITAEFQTPLSHVNVLSQNRGTPNMALTGAMENEELRALEGKWVELIVEGDDYSIREVTQAEADEWWDENRPEPLEVTPMDLSVTEMTDAELILDLENLSLAEALDVAVPAFGGKGSHYGGLTLIDGLPVPEAFVVPVYWYNRFMEVHGFWDYVDTMLADPDFHGAAEYRDERLAELRVLIEAAELETEFMDALMVEIDQDHPGQRLRFRSSTNAEDLSGFNGAGLYSSKSGDPNDPEDPVEEAVLTVWASMWNFRAYEEREYFSIDQTQVGMALLVHHSFPDEEANGVAITANVYDSSGLEPAFYINVQEGEESVVAPDPDVTTDQFLYYFELPGQPAVFIQHSNLVEEGETVLTIAEMYEMGEGLAAIHSFFQPVYGTSGGFYGMDVEFKFDDLDSGGEPTLWVKQARPYPGFGW
jgi:hypothetical protein